MASYVTNAGLNKMKLELEQLETIERPKITQQIAEARDKGDLSENAEYDAAKEAQGMLEMRISKLKNIIFDSKIIDETNLDTSKVSILTTVRLKNNATKGEQKFTLVPDNESDLKAGKISVNTPIAKGLLGKVVGETADIVLPNGNKLSFDILEIFLEA
ncbi:transcription elongation factor GreA [Chryseobacterium sp. SNU WT5]|uniref:transcription elongation factor GreA n=1 Tax=Chryseobacterium sp. SNU WT5 TaxID=2594269 RepID=UPI00117C7659|nr:transcription elongation factor GreA [Chryseobacterium sp. SNU WT5]QDP84639.1 transcription elongation factor GreA [Chryseobacterium sp. SNU WT5]